MNLTKQEIIELGKDYDNKEFGDISNHSRLEVMDALACFEIAKQYSLVKKYIAEHHYKNIISNLSTKINVPSMGLRTVQFLLTVLDYDFVKSMGSQKEEEFTKFLESLSFTITSQSIHKRTIDTIKSGEFMVTMVFGEITYTQGASNKINIELFVDYGDPVYHRLLNELVALIEEDDSYLEGEFELPGILNKDESVAMGELVLLTEEEKKKLINERAYGLNTYKAYLPENYDVYKVVFK